MRTDIRDKCRPAMIGAAPLRIAIVLATLGGVFILPPFGTAQESDKVPDSLPGQNLTALLETRGSLTLRDATLTEALFALREQWKIDMVVADNVEGNVNATFTGASLREILDSLLLTRGYGYRVLGNSIVVLPLDQLGALKPLFKSQMIPLEHVDPDELLSVVELLLSPQGKAISIRSAKSIMVLDYPDRTAMIRKQVEELDQKAKSSLPARPTRTQSVGEGPPNIAAPSVSTPDVSFPQPRQRQPDPFPNPEPTTNARPPGASSNSANGEAPADDSTVELDVRVFRPQYVNVTTLLPAIESLLSRNGRTAVLEKEDQIVVADEKAQLDVIEEAILALDRPRPQVRIWAMIYDCGLEDVERIGVNWNARFFGRSVRPGMDGGPADQIGLDSLTAIAPALGAPNGALTLATLGSNVEVTAVINALNSSSDSKLLADPNVVAANHESAKIEIVTEIPYQQLTEGLEGGSIGTTAFREAGVTLEVTPHIARDDTISLAINPKFSVLAGFTENDEQPIIDRREAKTTVRVHNGETFVLGGLRQRTKIQNRSGIPYLKDRKYIGKLFRFKQDTFRESELLVFITPQIIPPSAPRTLREEVASDFINEELDCNRRAPDVCWPCSNDDVWKSGGPRNLNRLSTSRIHSAEPENRAIVPPSIVPPSIVPPSIVPPSIVPPSIVPPSIVPPSIDSSEPTASTDQPPFESIYDEPIGSPARPSARNNDSTEFLVGPAITGQAAANSTVMRETKLPLTMRLKNALRVIKDPAAGQPPAAGGFGPSAIGGPGGESGAPGLDLNQLFNILPMSGRSEKRQRKSKPESTSKPIRLLRFLTPSPKAGKTTIPPLQAPPKLNGNYSDRLFTDGSVDVLNKAEAQETDIGKVQIERLQRSDIPTFDDELTAPLLP
jgi:general secretion pathway protein D